MNKKNNLNISYNYYLDVSDLRCPEPIIATKKKLKDINSGEVILIKNSEPSFELDLKVLLQKTGHKLIKYWEDNKFFFALVKKM